MELHALDAGRDLEREEGAALGDAVAALPGEQGPAELAQERLVEIDGLPVAVLEGEEAVAEGREQRVTLPFGRRVDRHHAELPLGARDDLRDLEVAKDELERVADGEERLLIDAVADRGLDDAVAEATVVVDPHRSVAVEGRARAAGREVEIAVARDGIVGVAGRDLDHLAGERGVVEAHALEERRADAAQAAHRLVHVRVVHVHEAEAEWTEAVVRHRAEAPGIPAHGLIQSSRGEKPGGKSHSTTRASRKERLQPVSGLKHGPTRGGVLGASLDEDRRRGAATRARARNDEAREGYGAGLFAAPGVGAQATKSTLLSPVSLPLGRRHSALDVDTAESFSPAKNCVAEKLP